MINIWIVLAIIFIHWICDFVCQSDWQAKNKSKSNKALLSHTSLYSLAFAAHILWIFQIESGNSFESIYKAIIFGLITFIAHTITDYFTSRLNAKLVPKRDLTYRHVDKQLVYFPEGEKLHSFFVSVGFDQVLHYAQLLLTYYYLTN